MCFDLSTNIAATMPPTKMIRANQKIQQTHARCLFFRRWPSSHESLLVGSAVTEVQNLKRLCGRPERPKVNCDEFPCRAKGLLPTRGDFGAFRRLLRPGDDCRVGELGCEKAENAGD